VAVSSSAFSDHRLFNRESVELSAKGDEMAPTFCELEGRFT